MTTEERSRTGPPRSLFTVREAARITGARIAPVSGVSDPEGAVVTGIEVDSRHIRPGDLFCALGGERVDGHDFVGRAFEAGAVAALVSRPVPVEGPTAGPLLVVDDVLGALTGLARHHLSRFRVPVIAITGSVGKTTTKDMIAAALAPTMNVLASRGNLNTDVGLPLTLVELGPEHEVACLEMGMRGGGQIAALAALARPETGVITNIGPVHIELLGSLEAIAAAKEELLWALSPEGVAVLNADDPLLVRAAEVHRGRLAGVITYGLDRPASVLASAVEASGSGMSFDVVLSGPVRELAGTGAMPRLRLPLGGRHAVQNALAAVACGLLYGASPESIRQGLARVKLSGMRQELTTVAGVLVINDTYNAAPASMTASLELLAQYARGGRTIALLGDMLELGDLSGEAHLEVGRTVARLGIGLLVTVGTRSEGIVRGAAGAGMPRDRISAFESVAEAAQAVVGAARAGDAVLVKASRGMRLEAATEIIVSGLRERGASCEHS